MRPPRHRFSEEVRTATRSAALRMVRDDEIARTPDQLGSWIAAHPDVSKPLERDGYGEAFQADDLYPLFEAYVEKAGGRTRQVVATARSLKPGYIAGAALLVAIAIGVLIGVLA